MNNIKGRQIMIARAIENMTQLEVSQILGIHRTTLSQIENEKMKPSKELQKKIDDLFGITLDKYFFTKQSNNSLGKVETA